MSRSRTPRDGETYRGRARNAARMFKRMTKDDWRTAWGHMLNVREAALGRYSRQPLRKRISA